MGQSTTEVRRDIERTRDEMSETIDAIADRTSPSRVLGRQRRRFADRFRSMRGQVMGTAEQARSSAQDRVQSTVEGTQQTAEDLAGKARELPDQAREQVRTQTQGNPMAAGLIAFGSGLLAAYLLPSSAAERRMAGQVRETAEPAIQELKQAGRDVAEDVKGSARQAVEDVKNTASDSAQQVAEDARSAAEDVREQAGSAGEQVRGKAQETIQQTQR